jgi:hypothetical protein
LLFIKIYGIIFIVDEKRVSITDNISSVTISLATAEKLQRKQPVIRREPAKRDSSTPSDSEVQFMTVDSTVWATARARAEQIASDAIRSNADDPTASPGVEARARINSYANKLIVIESDTSVTVHNNPEQARRAKEAQKNASKITPTTPAAE